MADTCDLTRLRSMHLMQRSLTRARRAVRSMRVLLLATSTLCMMALTEPAAADLIVNGGFESVRGHS